MLEGWEAPVETIESYMAWSDPGFSLIGLDIIGGDFSDIFIQHLLFS